MANSKRQLFLKRRLRVRNKLRKVNAGRVRLCVHRSNKNISAQLIDDVQGRTLAAASSLEKGLVRYSSEPTMRPRALSKILSLLDNMMTGVVLKVWLFLINAQVW